MGDLRIIFLTVLTYMGLARPRTARDFIPDMDAYAVSVHTAESEAPADSAEATGAEGVVDAVASGLACPTCYTISAACDTQRCATECVASCEVDAIRMQDGRPVILDHQDIPWPDAVGFWEGHLPDLHFGLVRQDRSMKPAYQSFAEFFTTLPDGFVGQLTVAPEATEAIFGDATNLGPVINNAYRTFGPSIAPDGNALYFAAEDGTTPGFPRLFVSDQVEGQWTDPQSLEMPSDPHPQTFHDGPCITYDDQTLYLTRGILSVGGPTQVRIWRSTRIGAGWSAPVDLGDIVNDPDPARTTSDPAISADGTALFFSSDRPGGYGGMDIWVSQWIDGAWAAPVNLGPGVNTAYHEREPTLAANGLGLAFASDRPGGLGNHDIWVSHLADGVWIPAMNLGPGVNSAGDDRDPEVTKDDQMFFLAGVRDGNLGRSDIWLTRAGMAGPVPVPAGTVAGLLLMGVGVLAAGSATLRRRDRPPGRVKRRQ